MKKLYTYSIYPLLVVFALVLHSQISNYLELKWQWLTPAFVSLIVIAVIQILEWLTPYERSWNTNRGDLVSDLISSNFVLPLFSHIAKLLVIYFLASHTFTLQTVWTLFPLWLQVIFVVLVAEFFFYWIHRYFHTSSFFWRFHAVHHGAHRVYWGNSGRFHPVDTLVSFSLYFFPIVLLGVPLEPLLYFYTLNAVTGLLEHANIEFSLGPLNYIFNSAELHRVHHAKQVSLANHNFGKITCIWDLVFKTFHKPLKKCGDVGIDSHFKEVPGNLLWQLIYPFQNVTDEDNKTQEKIEAEVIVSP
ncbi:MAG: sterol desaturase family protein [Halobacteriovoraceae bacterium]|nr:sterol desaturase family protein [Halobacteriovoraceae bacterium]MCB9095678.1 sterol desaturase family protein [Halobacteriovoraceae bacterium]